MGLLRLQHSTRFFPRLYDKQSLSFCGYHNGTYIVLYGFYLCISELLGYEKGRV